MALARLVCCHSKEPVPKRLAKGKLVIIVIKKTHNPPRQIMQPGKEQSREGLAGLKVLFHLLVSSVTKLRRVRGGSWETLFKAKGG